jgi:hypothetical protein
VAGAVEAEADRRAAVAAADGKLAAPWMMDDIKEFAARSHNDQTRKSQNSQKQLRVLRVQRVLR